MTTSVENPRFWLNAIQTAIHCTDCEAKQQVLTNAVRELTRYVDAQSAPNLTATAPSRDALLRDLRLEICKMPHEGSYHACQHCEANRLLNGITEIFRAAELTAQSAPNLTATLELAAQISAHLRSAAGVDLFVLSQAQRNAFAKTLDQLVAEIDAQRRANDADSTPKCEWYGKPQGEHDYITVPGGKRCTKCKHEITDSKPTAAGVADEYEQAIESIVRDCCETEPAPPDHDDTICINVDQLSEIVKHRINAIAAPSPPREPQALPDAIATKFWLEALRTVPSDCLYKAAWIEQRARDLARKAGTV